jgi:hypothetical protein
MQATFPLDQWQAAQVVAVQPQQFEGIEDGLAFAGHQLVELADAMFIEADNFAIQDGILYRYFSERFLQRHERFELVAVAGDQLAFTGLDEGDRAEAVVLQLEQILWIVERICHAGKAHGLDAGEHRDKPVMNLIKDHVYVATWLGLIMTVILTSLKAKKTHFIEIDWFRFVIYFSISPV